MPGAYRLGLGAVAGKTLEELSKHQPKAYRRERAAAVLKLSMRQVAAVGCLRRREWETVAKWVKAYEQDGVRGLYLLDGRGRKGRLYAGGDGSGAGADIGVIK